MPRDDFLSRLPGDVGAHGVGEAFAQKYVDAFIPHHNKDSAGAPRDELDRERTDHNAEGRREPGFASSAVPTQEEKTIMEGRPRKENVAAGYSTDSLTNGALSSSNTSTFEGRASDGTAYGAPANAPPGDNAPPRPSQELDNDQQRTAPEVRSTLREQMSIKSSTRWGVPTSRPAIHPDDFEDPICDNFWKDKWVASAAHNVGGLP